MVLTFERLDKRTTQGGEKEENVYYIINSNFLLILFYSHPFSTNYPPKQTLYFTLVLVQFSSTTTTDTSPNKMATIGDISKSDKINISSPPITNTHELEGVQLPTNNKNLFNNEMRESDAEDGDGISSNMINDDKFLDDTSSPGEKSLEIEVNVVQQPRDLSTNDKTITSTNTINQTSNDMRKTEDSTGDGDGSVANINIGYMRHYVVPSCYRSLFPTKYKTHMSHDIVILCPACHVKCQTLYGKKMNALEKIAGDLYVSEEEKDRYITDHRLSNIRSSAIALIKHYERLPTDIKIKHLERVKEYFKLTEEEELTEDMLSHAATIETRTENNKWRGGPDLLVNVQLNNDDGKIEMFVKAWRRYFIDVMKPEFLQTGWSVDEVVCR